MEIDVCRNWRPYAQWVKTLHFGCVNCGRPGQSHEDVCLECTGLGKGASDKGVIDDLLACKVCVGTGRISQKINYDTL